MLRYSKLSDVDLTLDNTSHPVHLNNMISKRYGFSVDFKGFVLQHAVRQNRNKLKQVEFGVMLPIATGRVGAADAACAVAGSVQ